MSIHHTAPNLPDRAKSVDITRIRPILRYMATYRLAIFGALIAIAFTSTAVLFMGGALRYLVDEGLNKGQPALLDRAFEIFLGVTLLLSLASYSRFFLVSWIGERIVKDIRRDVYTKLMRMDISFFEITPTGELLSRLMTDTTLLQTVLGSSVSIALRNSLMLLGGITMMLITSPRLTLYVALILPVVIVPILVFGRRVRNLSRSTQNKVADVSASAEESFSFIRTIQALSLETTQVSSFMDEVESAFSTAISRIRMRALLTAIVIGLVFGAIVTVLWIGGHDVLEGTLSAGELSAFVFYSVVVAGGVGAISEIIGDLQRAAGAGERLNELLSLAPSIPVDVTPDTLPTQLEGNVLFDKITFAYPSRPSSPALCDFSLTVKAGETVALVGPSGGGKTTLFQLLLRFYDPQSGAVAIDGHDLKRLEPTALRQHIGLVPQDPVIFSGNAWDNIRCGAPDADDNTVIAAAKAAAAFEFLSALPEGFDTHLGEKGVRLSGGQKQRIAIARAIIRNPRLLLLDEATSALDAENEQTVQQALEGLMQHRTTLVIAHRLATVLKADRIVVMNEGKIEAIGTHKELLLSSPLYARLAALQFNTA